MIANLATVLPMMGICPFDPRRRQGVRAPYPATKCRTTMASAMPQAAHGSTRAIRPRITPYCAMWSCATIMPNHTTSPIVKMRAAVRYSQVFG